MFEFIRVDVTSRCNFNCKICYGTIKKGSDIDLDKLIVFLQEFRFKKLLIGGGEPLLRIDIVRELVKRYRCEIISNGSLVRSENCKFLKKSFIWLSLDGHNERINSKHRDEKSFNAVVRACDVLRRNGVRFGIITCVSRANIDYLEEIGEFCRELGAERHSFTQFLPIGRGKDLRKLYVPLEEYSRTLWKLSRKYRHVSFDKTTLLLNKGF
jgi:MoaA/NifB/PqqE/SkfB family radical SAM enzyme